MNISDAQTAWEDAWELRRCASESTSDVRPDPDEWEDEGAELDRIANDLRSALLRLEAMEFTAGPLGQRQTSTIRSIVARLGVLASDARERSDTYAEE